MTPQQLRNSILQMAIEGKLTRQLPEDGNATDLLKKIKAEKARLIKEKKIKKEKPLPEIRDDEVPFEIPDNWVWCRLYSLGECSDNAFADGPFGSNLKSEHYTNVPEVRIIQLSNIGENGWRDKNVKYTTFSHAETIKRSMVEAGNIVIAKMMPAGRAIEVPVKEKGYILSSDAVKFVPHRSINKSFLLYAINSNVFREQIYTEVQGITRVRTSLTKLKKYLIPLPPLAEQKRIVARLDEILPLIDVYEKAYNELQELNTKFPVNLKNSLLQMAIEGKLVEQRPEDGNAADLLKQIKAEKAKLIKEKKIKKEKPLPPITEGEIPFEIPDNWCWVRWGDISHRIQYGYNAPAKDEGFCRMVRISDIQNGNIVWGTVPYCDISSEEANEYYLQKNDILFARTGGTVGKSFLVKEVPYDAVYAGYLIRTQYSEKLIPEYLKFFMESSLYWEQLRQGTIATAQPNCNGKTLGRMVMPLPPINVQKRIVDKLEQLLPLFGELMKHG